MSDENCFNFYKSIFPDFENDRDKWNTREFCNYAILNLDGKIVGCLTIVPNHILPGCDHIWLCGVDPKCRSKGYFKQLIIMFQNKCTDIVTVATYPKKWPTMFSWINKHGTFLRSDEDEKVVYTITKENLIMNN